MSQTSDHCAITLRNPQILKLLEDRELREADSVRDKFGVSHQLKEWGLALGVWPADDDNGWKIWFQNEEQRLFFILKFGVSGELSND